MAVAVDAHVRFFPSPCVPPNSASVSDCVARPALSINMEDEGTSGFVLLVAGWRIAWWP